ncbi:hypothetical protein [Desulfatiglans anilini]|uniref:hypothetical protein n=1 Tax=Desulfatiglans anilini TaxID=90728 RepID=UPI0006861155|nr:hypothetical protein [Desulfatiglans anilini]
MEKNRHRFSESYDGLLGFGFDRDVDASTLTYFLQRFAQDDLMALIRRRISQEDIHALADLVMQIMKKYLNEPEYHRYFLRDEEEEPPADSSPKTSR